MFPPPALTAMLPLLPCSQSGKQGIRDFETARDELNHLAEHGIADSELFDAAADTDDLELLAMLAMKIKTLGEWNRRMTVLEPLLSTTGFDHVTFYYNNLRANALRGAEQEKIEKDREWFDGEYCDYPYDYKSGKQYIDKFYFVMTELEGVHIDNRDSGYRFQITYDYQEAI